LGDYATISVPATVKKELEKMKKGKEWGEFLLDLANENRTLRGRRAFSELSAMLSKEELDRVQESGKEFRNRARSSGIGQGVQEGSGPETTDAIDTGTVIADLRAGTYRAGSYRSYLWLRSCEALLRTRRRRSRSFLRLPSKSSDSTTISLRSTALCTRTSGRGGNPSQTLTCKSPHPPRVGGWIS